LRLILFIPFVFSSSPGPTWAILIAHIDVPVGPTRVHAAGAGGEGAGARAGAEGAESLRTVPCLLQFYVRRVGGGGAAALADYGASSAALGGGAGGFGTAGGGASPFGRGSAARKSFSQRRGRGVAQHHVKCEIVIQRQWSTRGQSGAQSGAQSAKAETEEERWAMRGSDNAATRMVALLARHLLIRDMHLASAAHTFDTLINKVRCSFSCLLNSFCLLIFFFCSILLFHLFFCLLYPFSTR
jgi:hypothetical protein